jgi:hypothetical protein
MGMKPARRAFVLSLTSARLEYQSAKLEKPRHWLPGLMAAHLTNTKGCGGITIDRRRRFHVPAWVREVSRCGKTVADLDNCFGAAHRLAKDKSAVDLKSQIRSEA